MNESEGCWPILLLPTLPGEPQGQFLKSGVPFPALPRALCCLPETLTLQTSLAGSWAAGHISGAFSGLSSLILSVSVSPVPLERSEVGQLGGSGSVSKAVRSRGLCVAVSLQACATSQAGKRRHREAEGLAWMIQLTSRQKQDGKLGPRDRARSKSLPAAPTCTPSPESGPSAG